MANAELARSAVAARSALVLARELTSERRARSEGKAQVMEGLTRRPLLVQIGSDARAGVDASSHGRAVVSALLATTSKPTEQARGRLLARTKPETTDRLGG
jgi:hypothetical protein